MVTWVLLEFDVQTAKHFADEDGTLLNRAADELTWMSAVDFTPELVAAVRAAGTVGQIMLRRFMTDGDAFVMPGIFDDFDIFDGAELSDPDTSAPSDSARPEAAVAAAAALPPSLALVTASALAPVAAPANPIQAIATASTSTSASVGSTVAVRPAPAPAAAASASASASTAAAGGTAEPPNVSAVAPASHTAADVALRALFEGFSRVNPAAGFSNLTDLCNEFANILDHAAVLVRKVLISKAISEGAGGISESTSSKVFSTTLLTTPAQATRWVTMLANCLSMCEWDPLVRVLSCSSDPAAMAALMVLFDPDVSAVSPPTLPMRTELSNMMKRLLLSYMALTPDA